MKINNLKGLFLCLLACLLALGIGGLFIPGEWYENLNRAPWSPPNIAFPIVWSILYILIAIAGWKIFSLPKSGNTDLRVLWLSQLVINAIWSWIFFGEHWVLIGLIDIALLIFVVATIIVIAWRRDSHSISYLMLPYLTWLTLASSLNLYILLMN